MNSPRSLCLLDRATSQECEESWWSFHRTGTLLVTRQHSEVSDSNLSNLNKILATSATFTSTNVEKVNGCCGSSPKRQSAMWNHSLGVISRG